MKDYVESMADEAASGKADQEKDKVPTEAAGDSKVKMLNMDNFKDTVKSDIVFVKFFAPWLVSEIF